MLKRRLSALIAILGLAGILSVLGACTTGTRPAASKPSQKPSEIGWPTISALRVAPYYGTLVRFEKSADAAFARTKKEGKLVLILQLSGDFASSETT